MLAGHETLLHVADLQVVQGQHVLLLFFLRSKAGRQKCRHRQQGQQIFTAALGHTTGNSNHNTAKKLDTDIKPYPLPSPTWKECKAYRSRVVEKGAVVSCAKCPIQNG